MPGVGSAGSVTVYAPRWNSSGRSSRWSPSVVTRPMTM